jgi:hypothetical protein
MTAGKALVPNIVPFGTIISYLRGVAPPAEKGFVPDTANAMLTAAFRPKRQPIAKSFCRPFGAMTMSEARQDGWLPIDMVKGLMSSPDINKREGRCENHRKPLRPSVIKLH